MSDDDNLSDLWGNTGPGSTADPDATTLMPPVGDPIPPPGAPGTTVDGGGADGGDSPPTGFDSGDGTGGEDESSTPPWLWPAVAAVLGVLLLILVIGFWIGGDDDSLVTVSSSSTAAPSTTVAPTTVAETTVPASTTVAPTTVAATTVAPTTVAPTSTTTTSTTTTTTTTTSTTTTTVPDLGADEGAVRIGNASTMIISQCRSVESPNGATVYSYLFDVGGTKRIIDQIVDGNTPRARFDGLAVLEYRALEGDEFGGVLDLDGTATDFAVNPTQLPQTCEDRGMATRSTANATATRAVLNTCISGPQTRSILSLGDVVTLTDNTDGTAKVSYQVAGGGAPATAEAAPITQAGSSVTVVATLSDGSELTFNVNTQAATGC